MAAAAAAAASAVTKPLDVMVDIETLGTTDSAPVLSIGAVLFNADTDEEFGAKFHANLEVADDTPGEVISVSTIFWWLQQSDAARQAVACAERKPVVECLADFVAFASQGLGDPRNVRMWANSPSFDFVILRACMKRHAPDMKWPFSPFAERDVRTALRLTGVHVDRSGLTSHNALHDAVMQADAVRRAKKCIPLKAAVTPTPP